MSENTLQVTEDEALVLSEFFHRFDETDTLEFKHPAEYLALQKLAGQIDRTTPAVFSSRYESLLEAARSRIAAGFEGDVPRL